jgi:hypothetical protein
MRKARTAAIAATLAIGLAAAGCGDETAVVTVTTDQLPDTVPGATNGVTTLEAPTTGAPPEQGEPQAGPELSLEERLPPSDALAGTRTGSVTTLPTASSLTEALYAAGDPARIPAARELDEAGFAGAVLRDDTGTDPQDGVALFRSYVMELGGGDQARAEVIRSVLEVSETSQVRTESFPIDGIPGASGLTAEGSAGGQDLAVVFIAFPVDRYVYGLQVIARDRAGIDREGVVEIARQQLDDTR